jgi:hypothetical protein
LAVVLVLVIEALLDEIKLYKSTDDPRLIDQLASEGIYDVLYPLFALLRVLESRVKVRYKRIEPLLYRVNFECESVTFGIQVENSVFCVVPKVCKFGPQLVEVVFDVVFHICHFLGQVNFSYFG